MMTTSPVFIARYSAKVSAALLLAGVAWFSPVASHGATALWSDNGVVWGGTASGYYRVGDHAALPGEYDGIPNGQATPSWTRTAQNSGASTLNPTYLNINTTASATARMDYWTNYNWDASTALTLEFTLRINSGMTTVVFGNSAEWAQFYLGINNDGDLAVGNSSSSLQAITSVTPTEFNTYRITLSGMDSPATSHMALYINGGVDPVFESASFNAAASPLLRFGDNSASNNALTQNTDWQSIKWLSGQAIAPIPEPTTVAMLFGGSALLFLKAFRRRKS